MGLLNSFSCVMQKNSKSNTGFFLGLAAAILILFLPNPEGLPIEAQKAAAIFVWMGIWWGDCWAFNWTFSS